MQKEHFSTLKGEFLPYLVKKQMSKATPSTVGSNNNQVSDTQSELGTSIKQEDIFGVSWKTKNSFIFLL